MADIPEPTIRDVIKLMNDLHERVLNRLTAMESEIRDLRSEQPAMRAYVGARAGETEALMQRLFDRLNERLDQEGGG